MEDGQTGEDQIEGGQSGGGGCGGRETSRLPASLAITPLQVGAHHRPEVRKHIAIVRGPLEPLDPGNGTVQYVVVDTFARFFFPVA